MIIQQTKFVILSENMLTVMLNVHPKILCITNILNSLSVIRLREIHHVILGTVGYRSK